MVTERSGIPANACALLLTLALVRVDAGSWVASGGAQAGVQVWHHELEGTLGGRTAGTRSTARLDPGTATDTGVALALRLFGPVMLGFSYLPLSVDTTFTSDQNFSFGGLNFGFTAPGTVQYRLPMYEGDLRVNVLDGSWGRLGVIGALKVLDTDVTVNAMGLTERFTQTIPIPMLGLCGQVNFTEQVKAYGSFKLLDVDLDDVRAKVDDWELGIIGDLPVGEHNVRAAGGYRRLALELISAPDTTDEAFLDVSHSGPFGELSVAW